MKSNASIEAAEGNRPRLCPACGTPYPTDDGAGCPVCMLRQAAQSEATWQDDPTEGRFDHYELLRREDGVFYELGRGAMGVTYKAFDTVLQHSVALKVIDARIAANPSVRQRFLREARAAAGLRHQNVASVFYYGVRKSDGQCFYSMELVEGETLEARLRRIGPLPPTFALEVIAQVARALIAAEAHGLVHRDLKPANLMVVEGPELTVKVIDFGLAKTTTVNESNLTHGGFVGTPAFASPEQFANTSIDVRSDLYSLGITLWWLLIGQTPFRGSSAEVMYLHQHAPLPLEELKSVPQPMVALLELLLEKDPAERLQRPADLLQALPKVSDALKAHRTITHESLRETAAQRLGASGKAIEVLANLPEAIAGQRIRLMLWPVLLLVLGGGAILAVNSFFVSKPPAPQASSSSSPVVTVPEKKSIAVLPFESLSENKNDSYFADGVQDEILANVARVSELNVVSRTSVMQYRPDAQRNLRQISDALGVANVLEGTVRRAGNRVRITIELVDTRTDHTIWSEIYDRDLIDIFAVQSEVAETIAHRLSATLSPEEKKRIEAKPTDNLEAYDLYLRAKELISRSGVYVAMESDIPLHDAISLLEQAVRLDPNFTLAYCASAQTHGLLYFRYPSPMERAMGDAAIANALRLQPDLPEVRLAYAFHLYFCYDYPDYDRIREQLSIAKRGLSNSAEVFRLEAWMDRRQGKWEKAIQDLNEAITHDPGNIPSLYDLSDTMASLRQWNASRKLSDRLNELVPDRLIVKFGKGLISVQERGDDGPLRSAIAALPASMAEDPTVLTYRLCIAMTDRDWRQVKEIIEKFKGGEDSGQFAYGTRPVPIGCYSVLIARLQGESAGANPNFAEARQQLDEKVRKSPENALLLSQLAVVDALLDNKEAAGSEARRAAEMLPVSKDALDGAAILMNLVLVYVWTSEFDRAFEILVPLTKMPAGFCYGQFKLDPYWDPIRKDPRFEKLLAELAPKD